MEILSKTGPVPCLPHSLDMLPTVDSASCSASHLLSEVTAFSLRLQGHTPQLQKPIYQSLLFWLLSVLLITHHDHLDILSILLFFSWGRVGVVCFFILAVLGLESRASFLLSNHLLLSNTPRPSLFNMYPLCAPDIAPVLSQKKMYYHRVRITP
jgi:hypothetical protein